MLAGEGVLTPAVWTKCPPDFIVWGNTAESAAVNVSPPTDIENASVPYCSIMVQEPSAHEHLYQFGGLADVGGWGARRKIKTHLKK